jgi:uncharacterized repeat protein (TIGR03803 family)
MVVSGSMLYGMTNTGGDSDQGTIFEYNLITNQKSVLYSFAGFPNDGSLPEGNSLILSGSTLYGMTDVGGSHFINTAGVGTIFQFDLTTNTESVLHSFDGKDGEIPTSSLILSDNTLYGMTEYGGANDQGVVFSLTVPEPATGALLAMSLAAMFSRRRRRDYSCSTINCCN